MSVLLYSAAGDPLITKPDSNAKLDPSRCPHDGTPLFECLASDASGFQVYFECDAIPSHTFGALVDGAQFRPDFGEVEL